MMTNIWHVYAIEEPPSDGIYYVRLEKKYDLLSVPVETLMEFKNGEWIMTVPQFINEYDVKAWKHR